MPFIYLVDKAVETGYSKTHAAMLLSMLGITNTVGRVVAGWVSDRPWADCLLINNVALIVGGLSTMAVPFLDEYWMLVAYATVFGLCIGVQRYTAALFAVNTMSFSCICVAEVSDISGSDWYTTIDKFVWNSRDVPGNFLVCWRTHSWYVMGNS